MSGHAYFVRAEGGVSAAPLCHTFDALANEVAALRSALVTVLEVVDTLFSCEESGSTFLPEGVDIAAEQIAFARHALGVAE